MEASKPTASEWRDGKKSCDNWTILEILGEAHEIPKQEESEDGERRNYQTQNNLRRGFISNEITYRLSIFNLSDLQKGGKVNETAAHRWKNVEEEEEERTNLSPASIKAHRNPFN